ncbi:MAG: hypothetical protein HY901_12285 [Deltaproteobacteria bacterium]|nr:hypothetical protein [Deltaproteobacteria bacterium]
MKRVASLALAAVLAACAADTTTSAVSIPGPNSVLVNGRSLLVASTASNELRALDLNPNPRTFVRAPNPLFPLSIPTQPFPRALAGFTTLNDNVNSKGEVIPRGAAPPFAFALSTAGSQVTVVSSANLAPLGTMAVPDTTLAIAVRAWKPDEVEHLVLAATQAGNGALWAADFGAPLDSAKIAAIEPVLAVSLGTSVPQALAASPTDPNLVAVGDRRTGPDGLGRQGGLALCNLATGTVTRVDVGGPVMAVAFSSSGERLFGLLDSEACGGAAPCGGLFAVDLADPTSPTFVGSFAVPGAARGLAVGADAEITLPSGATKNIDPLVVVSSTTGSLYVVDGATLTNPGPFVTALNRLDSRGERSGSPTDGPQIFDAAGNLVATLTSSARTEELSLLWEGRLVHSSSGVPAAGAVEDQGLDFPALSVQAGDLVTFVASGNCAVATTTVSSVAVGRVELAPGFDTSCLPAKVEYVVRASGSFAVVGTVSGLVGRVAPGAPFTGAGISFVMGPGGALERDAGYVISIVAEYSIPVANSTTTLNMPGAAAFDPIGKLFYVVFAGGSALVELNPTDMRSGKTDVGLVTFR